MKRLIISLLVVFVFQFLCYTSVFGQSTLSGNVTDASSELPLIGATVLVKGTQQGTITDADGNYLLTTRSDTGTLVISYISYLSEEAFFTGSQVIDVSLSPGMESLNEVVVIGYGTQKKSHLTGSIAKLSSEGLDQIPVSRADQALQGKLAGLSIKNIEGDVGSAPEIRVRGMGSISADNAPLIVVDGYPVPDDLSSIDMGDVESIEILKDAASTAIYGSRGSNGVIMITTKSGTINKPSFRFSMYTGIKQAYKKHDMLNAMEWTSYEREEDQKQENHLAAQEGRDPRDVDFTNQYATIRYLGNKIDWQDEALRNGSIQNYSLSASGGSKEVRYYISGSAVNDKGLFKDNDYKKFSITTRVDAKLSNRIKVGINLRPSYDKQRRSTLGLHDFARTYGWLPYYHDSLTTSLTSGNEIGEYAHPRDFSKTQATDVNGKYVYNDSGNPVLINIWTSGNNNPGSRRDNRFRYNTRYRLYGNTYFDIHILDGLDFKTSFGGYVNYKKLDDFRNSQGDDDGIPYTDSRNELTTDLLSESFFTYNKEFGDHSLNFLAGFSIQRNTYNDVRVLGRNHPTDYIRTLNSATEISQDIEESYGIIEETALLSYIGRVSYAFRDRYLLSASARRDGSSLFGPENRWAWFPSASVGWRVTEEDFMKSISMLDQLKVRASYGLSGNNDIENYAHVNTLNPANYVFGSGSGVVTPGLGQTPGLGDVLGSDYQSAVLANRAITWEQTYEFNTGLDLAMYRNRLTLSFDYYYAITDQLLLEKRIPYHTGFEGEWNNIGKVRNKGYEVELGGVIVSKNDFSWKISGNFSTNDNKLISFGGNEQEITEGYQGHKFIAKVGEPAIQFFGYKTNGVWLSQEEIDANPSRSGDMPGSGRPVDTNGDGKIDDSDRVALGSPFPDFNWGLTNNIRYKNFDLSFLLQGVHGNEIFNADGYYTEMRKFNKLFTDNRYVNELYPGDGQTPIMKGGIDRMFTDYLIEDASFVALRDINIGYTLSPDLLKRIKLKGLRIYASGQNLFFITAKSYRGINPESVDTGSFYDSPLKTGAQRGAQPIARTLVLGLDLTF